VKHLFLSLLCAGSVALLSAQDVQPSFAAFETASSPAAPAAPRSHITTKKSFYRLGEKVLTLVKYGEENTAPFVLLSLHHSEYTASQAARQYVQKNGGRFIELDNGFQHHIDFTLFNREIRIDPDRIFTPMGRWADLAADKKTDHIISNQIAGLAAFILEEIPHEKAIVSVHNNSEGDHMLTHYKKGQALAREARLVHTNPERNENDFIVTTDKKVYEQLKKKNFNVVLQTYKVRDDGSLSVYCARTRRVYIGVETQLGHFREQEEMIAAIAEILK
jgi:hypothetical protein